MNKVMPKVKIWFEHKDAQRAHDYMVSLGYTPFAGNDYAYDHVQAWYGQEDGEISWGRWRYYFDEDSPEYKEIFLPKDHSIQAPPIGLRPKAIVDALRIKEILEAMTRYSDDGQKIPQEWLDELSIINSEKV